MARIEVTTMIDIEDADLLDWAANPRSRDELPVPDPEDWELRDVVAAYNRGMFGDDDLLTFTVSADVDENVLEKIRA